MATWSYNAEALLYTGNFPLPKELLLCGGKKKAPGPCGFKILEIRELERLLVELGKTDPRSPQGEKLLKKITEMSLCQWHKYQTEERSGLWYSILRLVTPLADPDAEPTSPSGPSAATEQALAGFDKLTVKPPVTRRQTKSSDKESLQVNRNSACAPETSTVNHPNRSYDHYEAGERYRTSSTTRNLGPESPPSPASRGDYASGESDVNGSTKKSSKPWRFRKPK